MDLSLELNGTHVLITGAAGHIGIVVVQAFLAAGAYVSACDIREPTETIKHASLQWIRSDITDELLLHDAFTCAYNRWGPVLTCVAVAGLDYSYLPHHSSLCDMSLTQWQHTNRVNADGTFLTARAWLRELRRHDTVEHEANVSLIIIGSEAGVFGVTGNADYASSKAAIQYGLVKSLTKDVVAIHPRARVNAIAPGAVHTKQFDKECADNPNMLWVDAQATVAMKSPVPIEQVAKCCLFLASECWSGSITGQVIKIDGGKTGKLLWGPGGSSI